MQKIVRIATVADQGNARREDVRRMTPDHRVALLLDMQRRFLEWDRHPMLRVATVRRLGGKSHAP